MLDMLDVDGVWNGVEQQMNRVQKDLLKDLMDMSLIKQNRSVHIIRDLSNFPLKCKIVHTHVCTYT